VRDYLQQMGLVSPVDETMEQKRLRAAPLHALHGAVAGFSTIARITLIHSSLASVRCSTPNFILPMSCGVTSSFIPVLLRHRSWRSWQRAATLLSRLLEIEAPVYRAVCTMPLNSKAVVSPLLCCVRKYSWILRRHMLSPMAFQRRVWWQYSILLLPIAPQAIAARADAVIDRIIAQLIGTRAG
jgi:hypothetical protein